MDASHRASENMNAEATKTSMAILSRAVGRSGLWLCFGTFYFHEDWLPQWRGEAILLWPLMSAAFSFVAFLPHIIAKLYMDIRRYQTAAAGSDFNRQSEIGNRK